MKKERETANKYRQQALEGDLMAMNNMGVCYAQGIGVVEDHVMASSEPKKCRCQLLEWRWSREG